MNIFICDDDESVLENYAYLTARYANSRSLSISMRTFQSAQTMLVAIEEENIIPSIIITDIYMDGLNGFEAAMRIRQLKIPCQIIFLTSSSDFVFDAYGVQPIHYLLKYSTSPLMYQQALGKAIDKSHRDRESVFTCSTRYETRTTFLSDIICFESKLRLMKVTYLDNAPFEYYETMEQVGKSLYDHGFVRISRNCIVNLHHVKSIKDQTLTLSTNKMMKISKNYYHDFMSSFSELGTQRKDIA